MTFKMNRRVSVVIAEKKITYQRQSTETYNFCPHSTKRQRKWQIKMKKKWHRKRHLFELFVSLLEK